MSQVFDLGTTQTFNNISWTTGAYYQSEIGRCVAEDSLITVVESDILNYSISNNLLISSVENISTSDCSLNLFSLDQIPQPEDKANAKYGISLVCPGNKFKALRSNFLNSVLDTASIISDNNEKEIVNSSSPIPENLQILCFSKYNSSSAKSGT